MAEDLDNLIRDNAGSPAAASSDGTNIQQHSLPDLIEANKHLGRKAAGRSPAKALTRMKIVPPGSV